MKLFRTLARAKALLVAVEAELAQIRLDVPDYEPCGDCGYDHGYEQAEAVKAHQELDL